MTIGSWIVFGFAIWCLGYFRSKVATQNDVVLISAPFWLLVLCGNPKAKELPSGVIHAAGVYIQTTGWLLVVFGIIANRMSSSPILTLVVIVASLLVSRLITSLITQKYRFEN